MTVIEKIKAEIERRIKECEATYPKDKDGYWFPEQEEAYAIAKEYKQLLSFLDTLEEKSEKPINLDLEKEIENAGKDVIRQAHYHNKIFDIPQTHFEDVQLMDIFKAGVYKGYELGRNAK